MSKFDEIRKQNAKWDVNLFDLIKAADPSETNRYIPFLVKCLKRNIVEPEGILGHLIGITNKKLAQFHQWHEEGLVEAKDILKYSPEEFHRQYEIAEQKAILRNAQRQVKKLYEDDTWLIVYPMTFEAAQAYGQSTRWCITQKRYWTQYENRYYYIFVINKKTDEKYAINKDTNNSRYQVWNAEDIEIQILNLPIPGELYGVIFKELKENDIAIGNVKFAEQGEEKTWKTSGGVEMLIDDMTTVHIENTLKKFKSTRNHPFERKFDYMRQVLERRKSEGSNNEAILSAIIGSRRPITDDGTEVTYINDWSFDDEDDDYETPF